jgi:stage 0 sporulation protein B (sporulation initiation phosphotransferase)
VRRESYISKLGAPELIVYLFSFQAEVKELILEIEMEHEIHLNKLQLDCAGFCRMLIALIEAFKRNACRCPDGEHHLRVGLYEACDKLEVRCKYHGDIEKELLLPVLEQIKLQLSPEWEWKINRRNESCMTLHIAVPLTT